MTTTVKTALLSVYHKDGIIEFARGLVELGIYIYASGGTAKHLAEAEIPVHDVASLVGGGAIFGHRVVTLSREVHAGLLAQRTPADEQELADLCIPYIDLVCVDLYPLEETISKPGVTLAEVLEKMDIGGPTMLSSGSKGQRIVVCDPKDRMPVLEMLRSSLPFDAEFLEHLAAKADYVVSRYRALTAIYRGKGTFTAVHGHQVAQCKYGENAWQKDAALYSRETNDSLALDKFKVVEGTPPSYNNWCDVERLLQTMTHMAAGISAYSSEQPLYFALGAKHGNLCGAKVCGNPAIAIEDMLKGDPLSIFGGLVMMNFPITEKCVQSFSGVMLDGIIAPWFDPVAIQALKRKNGKCRFIMNQALGVPHSHLSLDNAPRFRYVRGGILVQPNYTFVLDLADIRIARYGPPTSVKQEIDMIMAWAIGSTSNSNTITLVKNETLLGNAVGQQDRVGAAELAICRANRSKHALAGAVAYSDSFFPFPDGPETLIDAGVKAILTSSGSIRDQETIDLCSRRGISLYMIPDTVGRGFFGH